MRASQTNIEQQKQSCKQRSNTKQTKQHKTTTSEQAMQNKHNNHTKQTKEQKLLYKQTNNKH